MGTITRLGGLLVFGAVFSFANTAKANYAVSVQDSAGNSTAALAIGGGIGLNVVLDGNKRHGVNDFAVTFSRAGLVLTNFAFGAPFITDGGDDVSTPQVTDLPVVLADDTAGASGSAVDAWFTNFINNDSFGSGTVLSFDLEVPADYQLGLVDIGIGASGLNTTPLFGGDFFPDPIVSNTGFELYVVVPEPTTLALLGIGGLLAAMCSRRAM